MKKILMLLIILLLFAIQCSNPPAEWLKIDNGIELHTEKDLNVSVQFYRDDIVRVVKWLPQSTSEKTSLMVIHDPVPGLNVSVTETKKVMSVSSGNITVEISKRDGSILYKTGDDLIILNEKGIPSFEPADDPLEADAWHIEQKFNVTPDEGLYGLGQHQDGHMNYRGKTVKLVQSNTEAVTPFLLSTSGYGILWDNYSSTTFSDKPGEMKLWSDVADNVDYYFIHSISMDSIIAGYRFLTGQAPMYGKWAYGYWQSREHYDNSNELMEVAVEYRKRKIPIDNMIQDWDYWNGPENWSGMFFDKTLFPRPKQMIDKLHRMHYHLMISIWPALGPNTAIYRDMRTKGFLYEPVGWAGFRYYDAFNPSANDLYWRYLKTGLLSKGVDAWWIDSTEPDVINALTKGATEYEMKKVGRNYMGSWARYLNAFSLVMTDALYKNLRKETEKQRACILTRSTYAGQQRNAATTWSGDIGANWEVYKNQIAAGINHSMSGIPYWTFDIGAFVIGAYDGVFMYGGKDPAYQELYARMFQLGTFTPIFRSHGSETPREIWEMGEFAETMVQFDHLRYRLMPYIYSLAWLVTDKGYTLMRGLPMDFTSDKKTYSIDDQFMFGPAIMACPVTGFMYHRPPESSILIEPEYFKTKEGKKGLKAQYYKDPEYRNLSRESVDPNININWYTGRPDYVTDSTYAIRWEGYLIPKESGKHQFHTKCFDSHRIFLDGRELDVVYRSTERYTEIVELEAGHTYDFVAEVENNSTGAARMRLFWKTPSIFKLEESDLVADKVRSVYLPAGHDWHDFWTGTRLSGGQTLTADAPIETMPIYIKAGSIIPMGPFIQYADEKPADPLELRIYPGEDGRFVLYEDENDNYNYERGIYATIPFLWDDSAKKLTIGKRSGKFPGMLKKRKIHIILTGIDHGTGIDITKKPDKVVRYNGEKMVIQL